MTEKIDDGGFVIPTFRRKEDEWGQTFYLPESGLTVRQWFAGMATDRDVSLAAQAFMAKTGKDKCSDAEARYFHADEMIAEGKKK